MAAITLPTCPVPNEAEMRVRTFGGILVPFMGGPDQTYNRPGTRVGVLFVMPSLDNDEMRAFTARLMRAKQVGGIMNYPLFDFDPGSPPNPRISAASTGTALSMSGLGPDYLMREGQPFSVIHGGYRYLHFATGDVTASGAGTAVISIFPPTRVTFAVNDVVEIAEPKIEGNVSPGEEFGWPVALDNTTDLSFSIVESR